MRIYFAPCGIGLGHAGRCIEIAKRLENCEVLFSTYSDAVDFVKKEGFKFISVTPFSYWDWPDGALDSWRTVSMLPRKIIEAFLRQIKSEIEQIMAFDPDVIVSDSRLSSVIAGTIVNKPTITMLNQTFTIGSGVIHHKFYWALSKIFFYGSVGFSWNLSKKIVIPDFPMPYAISKNNLKTAAGIKKKMEYIGPILAVKPETLSDKGDLKRELGFDRRPLIYVPISGPKWERWWLGEKMIKNLSDCPKNYQVVISLGNSNSSSMRAICNCKNENVNVYNWIPNRFEMLKACDLVICRGGHTTVAQTLAYGKPMILIPAQEQTEQIYNAKTVSEMGLAKIIDQRFLQKELIIESVNEIFSNHKYIERAEEIMKFASKLDAISTIIRMILAMAKS